MNILYIERSASNGRNGNWIEELVLEPAPYRIVVGTGPGSFAGIRAALAFAQGYALGRKCEVLGLPSPCAIAASVYTQGECDIQRGRDIPVACSLEQSQQRGRDIPVACEKEASTTFPLAVIGDARRGMAWIALFNGYTMEREVFQVSQSDLMGSVPPACQVVTPDVARIDGLLRETFGERYLGGRIPTAEGLKAFAEANPSILKPEPLPIYLNPAVRD